MVNDLVRPADPGLERAGEPAKDTSPPPGRLPKDKDGIRTDDGLYFCVFSYLHPPDGYTAYLQYLPVPADRAGARNKPMDFPHVGAVVSTTDWLEANHPRYVRRCPVRGVRLPIVPAERVAAYICPERRMAEILRRPGDPLEEDVAAFTTAIAAASGVPQEAFGVTGSVAMRVHDPAGSDIDLVVYGEANARRVRAAFLAGNVEGVKPMPEARIERWLRLIPQHHSHTREEAAYLIAQRWNYGFFRGREFSLRAVRADAEIAERYGAERYRACELVRLQARITGGQPMFVPALYELAEVRTLEGPAAPVTRVVSFEWLYAGAFYPGQAIEVQGKLEAILPGDDRGRAGWRVVVGSAEHRGREYIRPLT